MEIRAKDFFSREEQGKIREAVRAAERETDGEIAIAVVDESDRYREAELGGALSFSALVALALSVAFHHFTIWFYIPVMALFLFPFLYLFRQFPQLKLAFLRYRRVEGAVRERAVYSFFQKGVYKTDEQTGILIYISLLERKVWILGDRGVYSKIAPDFWRSRAEELTEGIKKGRTLDALCNVISKCGTELARHFPEKTGRNQLDDDIIC